MHDQVPAYFRREVELVNKVFLQQAGQVLGSAQPVRIIVAHSIHKPAKHLSQIAMRLKILLESLPYLSCAHNQHMLGANSLLYTP